MTIYLWEIPENYPEKLIGRYERERSPDRFLFREGQVLSIAQVKPDPIIKFEVSMAQLEPYDCLDNTSSIPLVNQRLADLLINLAGDDIQLFDVKIECTDGELERYKILNVIHTVKGIDHEQSVYTTFKLPRGGSMIGTIRKLVYKPGCMGNHHLAKDEEMKDNLLVTQNIYDTFKREKITGVWLATPDEFYDLVHG